MKTHYFITLFFSASLLILSSCKIERYKGAGIYKMNEKTKRGQDYLQVQAEEITEENKKKNNKKREKELKNREITQKEEIRKYGEAEKEKEKEEAQRRRKVNTGNFDFY
jgi:hypothetical protein